MSRQDDIKKLLGINYRKLQKLKEQKATLGVRTDHHILTEIEDTEDEIEKLEQELEQLEPETTETTEKNEVVPTIPSSFAKSGKISLIVLLLLSFGVIIFIFGRYSANLSLNLFDLPTPTNTPTSILISESVPTFTPEPAPINTLPPTPTWTSTFTPVPPAPVPPTDTPKSPTNTPLPSPTPTDTRQSLPTWTPTNTPSPTPSPPTCPTREHISTSAGTGAFEEVTVSDGLAECQLSILKTYHGKTQWLHPSEDLDGCDISYYDANKIWITAFGGTVVSVNNNEIGQLTAPPNKHGYMFEYQIYKGDKICVDPPEQFAEEFGMSWGPDIYYEYDSFCYRGYCD